MPLNKNFMGRLVAIHELLSSGVHYSLEELQKACTRKTDKMTSVKTLYNDLRELKDVYGAPIPEKDRSGKPYYYTESFSLFGVLNPNDASLANEAVALIRKMQTLPQFPGLEEVMLKFEQQPGVIGKPRQSVIQFETNEQYSGRHRLTNLYQAIQSDHPVALVYTDFGKATERYTFSPYLLKEYNNRWHVYGWANEKGKLLNLALDRIDSLVPLPELRRRPDTIDWDDYLADVIGFTRTEGEPLQPWLIRVWFPRAHYVLTKPLHGSQRVVQRTDSFVDLQFDLIWNREFEAALFELGPDAELLEPDAKRADFAEKVWRMAERYRQ